MKVDKSTVNKSNIYSDIKLDLSNVEPGERANVKREIGQYIIEEIEKSVTQGRSPLTGNKYKDLTKEYADDEKAGSRNPNLQKTGDMLDSLKFENSKDGIRLGFFNNKKQSGKADGHNNFSGKSKLPNRRFIPKKGESFESKIKDGINEIIKSNEAKRDLLSSYDLSGSDFSSQLNESLMLDDITESAFFDKLFEDILNGQS